MVADFGVSSVERSAALYYYRWKSCFLARILIQLACKLFNGEVLCFADTPTRRNADTTPVVVAASPRCVSVVINCFSPFSPQILLAGEADPACLTALFFSLTFSG